MSDPVVAVGVLAVASLFDEEPEGVVGVAGRGRLKEEGLGGAMVDHGLFDGGSEVDVGEGVFDADAPFLGDGADDEGLAHVEEVCGAKGVGGSVVGHEVMEDFVGVWGGGPAGFGGLGDLGDTAASFDAAACADWGGDDDGVDGFEGGGGDADVVDDAFVDIAGGGAVDGAHDEVAGGADAHGFEEDFGFEAADFSEDEDGFAEAQCGAEGVGGVDLE